MNNLQRLHAEQDVGHGGSLKRALAKRLAAA